MDNKDIVNALTIVESYSKGNGCYNGKLSNFAWYDSDVAWLVAIGLFELSKMDYSDISELQRMRAVSVKHANLLAKQLTGKYDFTQLLAECSFVNKLDSNTQQFTFKRESKTCKVDLTLLTTQLSLLGLDLIVEESTTRSGGKVINYFYDVTTTDKV